jgi:hypothetical protein
VDDVHLKSLGYLPPLGHFACRASLNEAHAVAELLKLDEIVHSIATV